MLVLLCAGSPRCSRLVLVPRRWRGGQPCVARASTGCDVRVWRETETIGGSAGERQSASFLDVQDDASSRPAPRVWSDAYMRAVGLRHDGAATLHGASLRRLVLDEELFVLMAHLVGLARKGKSVPKSLPKNLIPPSKR